jgi:colicin import membrane protein/protein TonB
MGAASQYGYLRPQPRIGLAVGVSVLVHAGVVLGLVFWPAPKTTADTLREHAIVTRLVKLGRELPKEQLPRLEALLPATVDDTVNTSKEAQIPDEKRAKEEKKQKDLFAKLAAERIRRMMAKTTSRGELGTGSPDGSPNGDATEAAEGDRYLTQIHNHVRNKYVVPSIITEAERKHLKATVVIFLDAGGKLIKMEFEKRSGNAHFDNALESAVKKAAPFPAPPKGLAPQYRDQGIGLNFSI